MNLIKNQTKNQRYILSKPIARGGMAEIYLGKHVGDDGFQRIVAVKRILPHFAREADFVQMFRDEAHICKRLRHPNIVRVEGFEEVDGSYAIIMEFVDGSDLRSFLASVERNPAQPRIPIAHAVFIVAEAARGLHYAHERKDEVSGNELQIVHRDISPQNILLSYEGEVKVTDFGIADANNGFKESETKAGIVKGKYSYMSPEQITAKPLDRRTDVFALGIVLWEMIAMKRLFSGANEVETIEMVRQCRIPFLLSEVNPAVDADLEAIIAKVLAKDMRKRYQTAEELEKDLRRYLTKRHSEFTVNDLASLLQQTLSEKRKKSQEEIKKTLTSGSADRIAAVQTFNENYSDKKKSAAAVGTGVIELDLSSAAGGSEIIVSRKNSVGTNFNGNPNFSSASYRAPHAVGSTFNRAQAQVREVEHVYESGNGLRNFLILCFFIFLGGIYYISGNKFSGRKTPPQVQIRTQTDTYVQVHLNDQPYANGHYVKTPFWLEVPEGLAKIQISRAGYQEIVTSVQLKSGSKQSSNDIPLVAKAHFAPTRTVITGGYGEEFLLVIDDGFDRQIVAKGNKYTGVFLDLGRNKRHKISIYEGTFEGKRIHSCLFIPKSRNLDKPSILAIDVTQKRCDLKNPSEP